MMGEGGGGGEEIKGSLIKWEGGRQIYFFGLSVCLIILSNLLNFR